MSDQLHHGPITRRVIEAVRRHMRMKVVDFAAFRAGQEQAKALQNSVTPEEQLAKTHPGQAAYVYAQNQMSIMAEQLLQMPEMKSFVKQIGAAEDEFAPSWPPMSPVSTSYFTCWSTFDLGIGARRETLGDVIIAVAAECGSARGTHFSRSGHKASERESTLAKTRRALVHGDVSPKNILVGHRGPVILDAECAWYGVPAFDLAFCLTHLLLKSLVRPERIGLI
jgi:hypothetical protein